MIREEQFGSIKHIYSKLTQLCKLFTQPLGCNLSIFNNSTLENYPKRKSLNISEDILLLLIWFSLFITRIRYNCKCQFVIKNPLHPSSFIPNLEVLRFSACFFSNSLLLSFEAPSLYFPKRMCFMYLARKIYRRCKMALSGIGRSFHWKDLLLFSIIQCIKKYQ